MKKLILIFSLLFLFLGNDSIRYYDNYKAILDPAHGIETPGKRSPDGEFREYKWSREIIELLSGKLDSTGIDYDISNKTDREIGLSTRVNVTNKLTGKNVKRTIFISIHANAAGFGLDWENARGFSVYTTRGQTRADRFASILYDNFKKEFPDIKVREDWSDGDPDYESNFRVLLCRAPAVLIETMFQDNKEDVEIMTSDDFKEKFTDIIVNSIIEYSEYYK